MRGFRQQGANMSEYGRIALKVTSSRDRSWFHRPVCADCARARSDKMGLAAHEPSETVDGAPYQPSDTRVASEAFSCVGWRIECEDEVVRFGCATEPPLFPETSAYPRCCPLIQYVDRRQRGTL
jgi:hypothetical protein